ncbi:MAG: hypothetical protein ACKV0T_19380 [Planctomycetales bacterium]
MELMDAPSSTVADDPTWFSSRSDNNTRFAWPQQPELNRDQPIAAAAVLRRTGRIREAAFPCLWVFISLVSTWDTYLTVLYQEQLFYTEENPIGRMLLTLNRGDPSLLIGAKFLGSSLVLGVLALLYVRNRPLGMTVTGAIATFQLGLLGYLLFV